MNFTLREVNLSGNSVAAAPVDAVTWVIKGKGNREKGTGRGNRPSEFEHAIWRVAPVVPPTPPQLYMSVRLARQEWRPHADRMTVYNL